MEVIKKGYNPCSKTLKRHWREGKDGDLGLVYTIGRLLSDNRALTKTNPPTLWFVALTNQNRKLKIAYIQKGNQVILKTAYVPNDVELAIYERFGMAA